MNPATRLVLLVPLLFVGLACGSDDADSSGSSSDNRVSVADPWVRQPAVGQPAAAAYGVITNGTDGDIVLVGAVTEVAGTVEIHETLIADDGAMAMNEKDGGFSIAAGQSLVLEPGGPHVMLLDIGDAEFPDPVPLTLLFDAGSDEQIEVDVEAELREIDGSGMDMGGGTGGMEMGPTTTGG